MIRGGNELGNHAMRDEPSRSLSDAALEAEIYEVRDMLAQAYAAENVEPPNTYFRPGSGFFSDRMRRLVDKLGYRLVLGGIYPHDPQIPYPGVNARHILEHAEAGGHRHLPRSEELDGSDAEEGPARGEEEGYKFVTVTELLEAARSLGDRPILGSWSGSLFLFCWSIVFHYRLQVRSCSRLEGEIPHPLGSKLRCMIGEHWAYEMALTSCQALF